MLAARSAASVREMPSVGGVTVRMRELIRWRATMRQAGRVRPLPRVSISEPCSDCHDIKGAAEGSARALRCDCALVVMAACGRSPPLPPAIRFTVPIPEDRALAAFAVSSDGRWLAYSAERDVDGLRRLFIRSLAEEARRATASCPAQQARARRSFRLTVTPLPTSRADRFGEHRFQRPGLHSGLSRRPRIRQVAPGQPMIALSLRLSARTG